MSLKESIEVEEAVRITSPFESFDGDLEKWKDAFYQVWRFQLTWSFAYEIALKETRSAGVYLSMLVKPKYKSGILEVLDDLGYRDIHTYAENVGVLAYVSDKFLDRYIDVVVVD